jgi:ribosome-binding factor A
MSNPRANKVAERIHQVVASFVINRLKDPRLELVTVTQVRVTGDLQHATVFYTVYGDKKKLRDAGRALMAAKGNIRSQVGRELGLRLTPTIEFVADELPETARSLEDALTAARHKDAQIAKAAEGAVPAGDADPYKKPHEAETDAGEA